MQTNTLKNMSAGAFAMGFVGDALNVVSAAGTIKASQEEGDHIAVSLAKGGTEFVVGEMFYGAMAAEAGMGGMLAGSLAMAGITTAANLSAQHMKHTGEILGRGSESVKSLGSGHFDMTQAGYTMRPRSLNAIRSNGANINSAFGNEARNYYLGL